MAQEYICTRKVVASQPSQIVRLHRSGQKGKQRGIIDDGSHHIAREHGYLRVGETKAWNLARARSISLAIREYRSQPYDLIACINILEVRNVLANQQEIHRASIEEMVEDSLIYGMSYPNQRRNQSLR